MWSKKIIASTVDLSCIVLLGVQYSKADMGYHTLGSCLCLAT